MQNKFIKFIKTRGYYIVLLICAVAVGVTGYFLLTSDKEKTISVDAPVTSDALQAQATEHAESVVATQDQEVVATENTEPFALTMPVNGKALTAFAADHLAYNATTKDWRTHEGVDFSAEIGQNVCAAADGKVHSIYEDENYGMTVVISHADGYVTYYSNLAEDVTVSVGQSVTAGTVLGAVGTTANAETATAPHLHFALWQNGKPLDPHEFLKNQ